MESGGQIYRGAEAQGIESPSFWGSYERVLVTSGLSKAYGLPGLRIGWVAGPPAMVHDLWARKDYTSIAPGAVSDFLARKALDSDVRPRLLERTRTYIRTNLPVLQDWMATHPGGFHLVPPQVGAIAFARYAWPIGSTRLMERLRDEQGVLVVPGDQFGLDGYLRIGFGNERDDLRRCLSQMDPVFRSLDPLAKS